LIILDIGVWDLPLSAHMPHKTHPLNITHGASVSYSVNVSGKTRVVCFKTYFISELIKLKYGPASLNQLGF
jgi:hypothetical protein